MKPIEPGCLAILIAVENMTYSHCIGMTVKVIGPITCPFHLWGREQKGYDRHGWLIEVEGFEGKEVGTAERCLMRIDDDSEITEEETEEELEIA